MHKWVCKVAGPKPVIVYERVVWVTVQPKLGIRHEKTAGESLNKTRVRGISRSSSFPTYPSSLEIDSARDGTHCGGKVVMDERRLNGDESTKVVRARSRGDRGQGEGACLNDFNLCDVRFHIIEAFLLHRSGVEVARDDAVFDKGHRVILKAGNRSELPDERASWLTRAKATSDEHTSDPGAG